MIASLIVFDEVIEKSRCDQTKVRIVADFRVITIFSMRLTNIAEAVQACVTTCLLRRQNGLPAILSVFR